MANGNEALRVEAPRTELRIAGAWCPAVEEVLFAKGLPRRPAWGTWRVVGPAATIPPGLRRILRVRTDCAKQLAPWAEARRKIVANVCAARMFEPLLVFARHDHVDYGYKLKGSLSLADDRRGGPDQVRSADDRIFVPAQGTPE